MESMDFTDGERTFTCRAEGSKATPGMLWWWVNVTGEASRYAAFRAEPGDTVPTLRPRIVAYYEEILAIRARPPITRMHWSQRRQVAVAAAAQLAAATATANGEVSADLVTASADLATAIPA